MGHGSRHAFAGLLGLFLAVASCGEKSWWCQREAQEEGRALRCQASKKGCEKYLAQRADGCEAKPEAWCFRETSMGDLETGLVCAVSETDCNAWRKERSKYEPTACEKTPAGAF